MSGSPTAVRLRLALFAALAFLILGSYEIARPATESIFLSEHGAAALPNVWILVALGATAIISIYNLYAARVRLTRLMAACAVITGLVLVALKLAVDMGVPGASYLLYLWKDVYVVILVELFWTMANASLPFSAAKWVYGLLCAMGSLGAIVGARLLKRAVGVWEISTSDALLMVLPLLALTALLALGFERLGEMQTRAKAKTGLGELLEGIKIFKESRYLSYLLALILVIQLIVTLVDYQFNAIIEADIIDKAARTAKIADVYAMISVGALIMQVIAGLFITVLGVRGNMLMIPGLIFISVLGMIIHPRYVAAAAAKALGKILDYSLFRATKELLYLPLPYREKTQGKALIDMLTYRLAKGGVALILKLLLGLGLASYIGWITLGWAAVWLALAAAVTRRYLALTAEGGA